MIAGLLHNGPGPRENVDLTGLTRAEFNLLRSMYPLYCRQPFPGRTEVMADLSGIELSEGLNAESIAASASARQARQRIDGYCAREFECLFEVVRRANRSAEALGEASSDDIFATLSVPLAVAAGEVFGKPFEGTEAMEKLRRKIQAGLFQYRRQVERGRRDFRKSNRGKSHKG